MTAEKLSSTRSARQGKHFTKERVEVQSSSPAGDKNTKLERQWELPKELLPKDGLLLGGTIILL